MQVDLSKALEPLLRNWHLLLGFILISSVVRLLALPFFKGWFGERAVQRGLAQLDAAVYHSFHDLYFPRPDGQGTTQIDHIVVSPFGIFVIETKNYSGWIFGCEKQRHWTQQIYQRKHRFQNPMHQNLLHIRAVMEFLQLPETAFQSVVFFVGNAEFKTPMPPHVLNSGLRQWIENHQETQFKSEQVHALRTALTDHDRRTNRRTAAHLHRNQLRKRLGR